MICNYFQVISCNNCEIIMLYMRKNEESMKERDKSIDDSNNDWKPNQTILRYFMALKNL